MTNGFCELNEQEMIGTDGGAGSTYSHAEAFGSPQEKANCNRVNGTDFYTGVYTFWDAFWNGGKITD